jgi:hypothetical protein
MAGTETADGKGVRLYPPPPKDFDPFKATRKDLKRHGLPLRPDRQTDPEMAALWERKAARYRSFEHLEPRLDTATAAKKAVPTPGLPLDPFESCGYQLSSSPAAPFTALFITWTVPDLWFTSGPYASTDYFRTFVSLGLALDLHVEMTVDPQENVSCYVAPRNVPQPVNLPVRPGDVLSAALCFENTAGAAAYFIANETTAQTINFSVNVTDYPPAVSVEAGISRGALNQPFPPLARFGAVYFDEISAYTTSGPRSLTSGQPTTMVDQNGGTLATPVKLNDYAFKTVYGAG